MCSPTYFNVSYDINPWMTDNIGSVDRDLAIEQWNNLYNIISKLTDVVIMDGVKGNPDLVFTANAGIVSGQKVVLSKFAKQERQKEETIFKRVFSDLGYNVLLTEHSYEGEGDHLVDSSGRHYMGYNFRTTLEAAFEVSKHLGTELTMLKLVDSRWYHLDTCFCPLPNGEILWYPDAFDIYSQNSIRKHFTKSIEISLQDALSFSCNSVCLGNHIILPKNIEVSNTLKSLDYITHEVDLSEFMKAGGAAKCLTLYL